MIFKSKQRIPNKDIEFKGAYVKTPIDGTKRFFTADPICKLLTGHLYTFEFNDETYTMKVIDDIFLHPNDKVIKLPTQFN